MGDVVCSVLDTPQPSYRTAKELHQLVNMKYE